MLCNTSETNAFNCSYESDLKPSSPGALEEDEGFSDWTQRAERSRQARQEQNGPREEDLEVERAMNGATGRGQISSAVFTRQHKTQCEAEEEEEYRPVRKSSEKRIELGERPSSFRDREAEAWKEEARVNKRQEPDPKPHIDDKVRLEICFLNLISDIECLRKKCHHMYTFCLVVLS